MGGGNRGDERGGVGGGGEKKGNRGAHGMVQLPRDREAAIAQQTGKR